MIALRRIPLALFLSGCSLLASAQQGPVEVLATALRPGPDGQLLLTAFPDTAVGGILVHANTILSPQAEALLHAQDGRTIATYRLTGPDTGISLGDLPPGTYMLTARDGDRPLGGFTIVVR